MDLNLSMRFFCLRTLAHLRPSITTFSSPLSPRTDPLVTLGILLPSPSSPLTNSSSLLLVLDTDLTARPIVAVAVAVLVTIDPENTAKVLTEGIAVKVEVTAEVEVEVGIVVTKVEEVRDVIVGAGVSHP